MIFSKTWDFRKLTILTCSPFGLKLWFLCLNWHFECPMPSCRYALVKICNCANIHLCRYAIVQICSCANMQSCDCLCAVSWRVNAQGAATILISVHSYWGGGRQCPTQPGNFPLIPLDCASVCNSSRLCAILAYCASVCDSSNLAYCASTCDYICKYNYKCKYKYKYKWRVWQGGIDYARHRAAI